MPYGDSSPFNPTTDINVEDIFNATSSAAAQNPSARGEANAKKLTFGAAQNTVSDPAMIAADGTVTINETGLYRFKFSFQFGRTGSGGTAKLLFRISNNDVQLGRTISVSLVNIDAVQYFENDTWIYLPAGQTLQADVMRDLSGADDGGCSGGLIPTDEGAGTWDDAPACQLILSRWVSQ